jgi:Type VI secretion system effector, Hcp
MERRDQLQSRQAPEEFDQGRQKAGRPLQAAGSRALALQRSAGNRSVSAVLARDPDAPVPDAPVPEEGPTPMSTGGAGLVTLPDIGAIPVTSASLGNPAEQPTHMGGGGSTGRSIPRDMRFTSSLGDHSVKLAKALSDGTSMSVDVAVSAFQLKLTEAIVSSYSTSGGDNPAESWSLNFASFVFIKP